MISRLIIAVILFSSTFLPGGVACIAAEDSAEQLEYKIKTAFLFNFAKFVDWPAGSFSGSIDEFTIGVIAPPKLASTAKLLQNKKIKGTRVKVITFESSEELVPCHILFIGMGDEKLLTNVIARFKNSPVLTVADTSGFASKGGDINFIAVDKTIRFEINPEAAKKKNLKISSKLLNLARIVGTAALKGNGK